MSYPKRPSAEVIEKKKLTTNSKKSTELQQTILLFNPFVDSAIQTHSITVKCSLAVGH